MRVGQGIFIKLNYADGGQANYKRPFLIIDISQDKVFLLNVSSLNGKVHKIGFPTNMNIGKYKPPFKKPSFVKLNALYIIDRDPILENFILDDGRAMHPQQLADIMIKLSDYKDNGNMLYSYCSIDEFIELNDIPALGEVASATQKE